MSFLKSLFMKEDSHATQGAVSPSSSKAPDWNLEDHILGTIYGQCIGDTIGLLTEFMIKTEAEKYYGQFKELEFEHKVPDMHRNRWEVGDWTDDSDQMILILQCILESSGHPQVDHVTFGQKLLNWARHGFSELGDHGGMGLGATTSHVLKHTAYSTDPHKASQDIWEKTGKVVAPNGAVMRTSILGVHQYTSLDTVIQNAVDIAKTTHADPRCQASCVAVTCAIALMLQRRPPYVLDDGSYDVYAIMAACYQHAKHCVPDRKWKSELKKHMFARSLKELKLDEQGKIGYTYKCMGAGFWALRQHDFRKALQAIVMEAGDADTNGAVAGALLGCKLGYSQLPSSWRDNLKHKEWLGQKITMFLSLVMGHTQTGQDDDTGGSTVPAPDSTQDVPSRGSGEPSSVNQQDQDTFHDV